MNTQTQKSIPTFPLGFHYQTESSATLEALHYSNKYRDQFIYVIYSTTTGRYRLDYIGISYSDEKIIASYFNNDKTL